jgi:hypothetical protein
MNRMLKIFEKIVDNDSEKITKNDYELAIYYHILNNKLDEAKIITTKALIKYPNSEIFD